jgi:MFS transporter, DHA1 family, inner membrane transport protein
MTETSPSERRLLWLFAGIQLTLLLDFMILMPLGPQLMQAFEISTSGFGLLVSAYTFASAVMGLLGAVWVDRFARRTLLSWLYGGFTLATLCCALAPNAAVLLGARVLAGAAAGLLWAVVMALIVDTVPESRRGSAIGLVMSAYAVSAVGGVPAGLLLASVAGFRAPFVLVTGLSGALWLFSRWAVPKAAPSAPTVDGGLGKLLRTPGVRVGWLLTFLVVSAGFLLIPYLGTFMVGSLGLSQRELSLV